MTTARAARGTSADFPPTLKRLGQHFLADRAALDRIVDTLAPTTTDTVVEIGPGRGALTDVLLPRAGHLVAVELDRALAALLRNRYGADGRVTIVERDVLKIQLGEIAGPDYLLVGNVPYYITTPILFHALSGVLPRRAVFLVQREVAERATAPAGSRIYGALSVNVQVLADVECVFDIPPTAFRPPPRVDSTVIRLTPRREPLLSRAEQPDFQRFVQSLFSQRRKQLGTILRSLALPPHVQLSELGLDLTQRPERLTPTQILALFRSVRQGER